MEYPLEVRWEEQGPTIDGVEIILGTHTIGYVRTLTEANIIKSHIERWWDKAMRSPLGTSAKVRVVRRPAPSGGGGWHAQPEVQQLKRMVGAAVKAMECATNHEEAIAASNQFVECSDLAREMVKNGFDLRELLG